MSLSVSKSHMLIRLEDFYPLFYSTLGILYGNIHLHLIKNEGNDIKQIQLQKCAFWSALCNPVKAISEHHVRKESATIIRLADTEQQWAGCCHIIHVPTIFLSRSCLLSFVLQEQRMSEEKRKSEQSKQLLFHINSTTLLLLVISLSPFCNFMSLVALPFSPSCWTKWSCFLNPIPIMIKPLFGGNSESSVS